MGVLVLSVEIRGAGVSRLNSIFTLRGGLEIGSSELSLSIWWDKSEMLPTHVVDNFLY